ncbi:uncharacterized protein C8Q71DRAFT_238058 [Rhodofomes roseus]|uniref:DUF4200 domain-containing protein n=1 Tax=Rhodofomes roseus TaxID=34475 RepID=A0ABQ8KW19_9APHY|nr:uncharacterized protein C8Q71DRAFT_238058 [Rhodofomes roseus]KAH9843169.1 hypothetical protein C8Q71DRAFT_238058 [Rhodofomes roseus]
MPMRKLATTVTGEKSVLHHKARATTKGLDADEDQVDEIQNDEEEQDGDENGMLEMFTMLQAFQKRKASKSSTRSVAFHTKKNALFTDVRATVDTLVREGATYIDQCKTRLAELKAQEVSQEKHLKDLSALRKNQENTVRDLLKTYPVMIEDLSHRRAAQINESSELLEGNAQERQESRKRLIHLAKARADEILERQKLATDATALIKHYKALLLA